MRLVGLELRAHGEPAAGRAVLERALAWHRRNRVDSYDGRRELARALYDAEHWTEARAAYEHLRAEDSLDGWTRQALGALAARRGDQAEALAADAWLASARANPDGPAENVYGRAVIAALLGDRARAVELLREAFRRGFAFIPVDISEGPELDADLETLRGYPPFEELVKPRG
jgi:tetratricopeptide (TPR) repeat protein